MLSLFDFHQFLVAAKVHFGDPACANVRVEAFGLVLQVHHHGSAIDAFSVAGEVVDVCRFGELSAGLHSLVENGLHVRASGIDGGCISCGSRSNDQALDVFLGFHRGQIY